MSRIPQGLYNLILNYYQYTCNIKLIDSTTVSKDKLDLFFYTIVFNFCKFFNIIIKKLIKFQK